MKIIDNKKDYYDYISGINGIDEYVVYDRRGSISLVNLFKVHSGPFNSSTTFYKDERFYVVVVAGEKKFVYVVDRKISDRKVHFVISTWDELMVTIKSEPGFHWVSFGRDDIVHKDVIARDLSSKTPLLFYYTTRPGFESFTECIKNPILSGIPIYIPAEEIWSGIYNYLLKEKEPKMEDNRTDIEHLESHGFDKKTSFRKM